MTSLQHSLGYAMIVVRYICIGASVLIFGQCNFAYAIDKFSENQNICGPVSLAAAIEYVQFESSLDEVFHLLPCDGQPKTLKDLLLACEKLSLPASAVNWTHKSQVDLTCPAIICLKPQEGRDFGHFVVLLASHDNRFYVLDALANTKWIPADRLWDIWDGTALHICTKRQDLPQPRKNHMQIFAWTGIAIAILGVALLRGKSGIGLIFNKKQKSSRNVDGILTIIVVSLFAFMAIKLIRPITTRDTSILRIVKPDTYSQTIDVMLAKRERDGSIPVTYKLHNYTTKPVIIREVSASCSCLTPTVNNLTIMPGEDSIVSAALRREVVDRSPLDKQAITRFTLVVYFRDPQISAIELSGVVKRPKSGR